MARQMDLLQWFSHDLRTSLTDVTGFASILDDEIPGHMNPRQHGYVGRILGAADRMLRLIENMLAYGALAGEAREAPVPTDYARLVAEAIDPLRPIADNRMTRIQVKVDVPGRPMVDRRGIGLVIGNLVAGALNLNGLGGMVEIEAKVEGGQIVTRVREFGQAPPDEQRGALEGPLVDPRFLDPTTFGLSLCRRMIEADGGQVGVELPDGGGCVFWFRVPFEEPLYKLDVA